jgi:hypothetical protein
MMTRLTNTERRTASHRFETRTRKDGHPLFAAAAL